MVSGGGDGWVGVWDWPHFKLRRRLEGFTSATRNAAEQNGVSPVAVSGIWTISAEIHGSSETVVAVACEGAPELACFAVSDFCRDSDELALCDIQKFGAPVLDITCAGTTLLVSLDARKLGERARIRAFRLRGERPGQIVAEPDSDMDAKLQSINSVNSAVVDETRLDDLLLAVEKLRKRANQDAIEEGDGEVQ